MEQNSPPAATQLHGGESEEEWSKELRVQFEQLLRTRRLNELFRLRSCITSLSHRPQQYGSLSEPQAEASSGIACWKTAEISSVTMCSETGLESSEASVKPCLFGRVPSHSLPIFYREDWTSRPVSHFSPVDKFDTKHGFSQRYKAIEGSSAVHHNSTGAEYRPWIYRHMKSCIPEKDKAVALHVLRWVTYAARPLYTGELLDAIKLQMSVKLAESDIERICGGFIKTTETGTVCLVHSSVQDYLESQNEENTTLGRGTISTTSHEMITKTCFRILKYENLLKSPNTPTVFDLPVTTTTNTRSPNLYSYAKQHWRFHYTMAEHQSDCLPGILHEKLRDDWKQGDSILVSKYDLGRTATDIGRQGSSILSTVAFLNVALQEGARSGMVRLVKLELEMGASPNAPDSCGMTPLHYAAAAGNCEVVKILMEYGSNASAASNSGDTALSLAVANGHIEAVKLLVAPGLVSTNNRSGTYQNENEQISPHAVHQKLSLVVSLSSCYNCGNMHSHYLLSKLPKSENDDKLWLPIHVTDKSLSQAECRLSEMQENDTFCYGTVISEQIAMLKWFPGIIMYQALRVAAKSGMEDVLRLLILAGNDIKFLEKNIALSRMMAKLQISQVV